jgi:hypothetical protein
VNAWLHPVLYYSTDYQNSRQNIIILFWIYLVDIGSKTKLNLFWELHKWKIVCSVAVENPSSLSLPPLWMRKVLPLSGKLTLVPVKDLGSFSFAEKRRYRRQLGN